MSVAREKPFRSSGSEQPRGAILVLIIMRLRRVGNAPSWEVRHGVRERALGKFRVDGGESHVMVNDS
jgi:hypothetical protein